MTEENTSQRAENRAFYGFVRFVSRMRWVFSIGFVVGLVLAWFVLPNFYRNWFATTLTVQVDPDSPPSISTRDGIMEHYTSLFSSPRYSRAIFSQIVGDPNLKWPVPKEEIELKLREAQVFAKNPSSQHLAILPTLSSDSFSIVLKVPYQTDNIKLVNSILTAIRDVAEEANKAKTSAYSLTTKQLVGEVEKILSTERKSKETFYDEYLRKNQVWRRKLISIELSLFNRTDLSKKSDYFAFAGSAFAADRARRPVAFAASELEPERATLLGDFSGRIERIFSLVAVLTEAKKLSADEADRVYKDVAEIAEANETMQQRYDSANQSYTSASTAIHAKRSEILLPMDYRTSILPYLEYSGSEDNLPQNFEVREKGFIFRFVLPIGFVLILFGLLGSMQHVRHDSR